MSDEAQTKGEPEAAAAENDTADKGGGAAEGDAGSTTEEPAAERVDEDGLPLDRDATIDDVRSKEGLHGRVALGCTITVVLLLVLFWLIRGGVIG